MDFVFPYLSSSPVWSPNSFSDLYMCRKTRPGDRFREHPALGGEG